MLSHIFHIYQVRFHDNLGDLKNSATLEHQHLYFIDRLYNEVEKWGKRPSQVTWGTADKQGAVINDSACLAAGGSVP